MAVSKKPENKNAPAKAAEGTAAEGQIVKRRGPFDLMDDLERWFEDEPFARWPRMFGRRWPEFRELTSLSDIRVPRVDVVDGDKEITVKAELPGVKKEDLEVTVTDNRLRISATTRSESQTKDKDYVRREISSGAVSRTLTLPAEVDADAARASFSDGILTLTLPKLASARRRTLKIS